MNKKIIGSLFFAFSFLALVPQATLADSATTDFETPTYSMGSVNGQNGWIMTGPYDQAIVDVSLFSSSTGQALRVSDGQTSGSFGDWIFVRPLTDSVGEIYSTNGTFATGTRQTHFEAQFDIASAVPTAQQPGLHVSVSPDRGDGSRMSYLRFEDGVTGIDVFFDDVSTDGLSFNESQIATGLDRMMSHTVKLTLDAVDGPSNDVVNVYIDGSLVKTGTSWENYFRLNPESSAEQTPRSIKTLIIQARGTATPANSGKGFLFDNVALTSSTPGSTTVAVNATWAGHTFGTAETSNGSTYYYGLNAFSTIQAAVNAANSGATVSVAAGTYAEQVTLTKNVTLTGEAKATTIIQGSSTLMVGVNGKKSILEVGSGATATVSNITVNGPGPSTCGSIDHGIFVVGGAILNLSNANVTNIADAPLSGCQNGRAIQVGSGPLSLVGHATIDGVTVTDYQKTGIVIDGTGSTGTISNSTVTGVGPTTAIAQNGIQISRGATGSILNNSVSGNSYTGGTGDCAGDGSTAVLADYLNDCTASAGILLYQQGSGITISGNTVSAAQLGIALVGGATATITKNNLSGNILHALDVDVATDASLNYWGLNSTSTIEAKIGGSVTYDPWYTDATLTMFRETVTINTASSTASVTFDDPITASTTSTGGTVTASFPDNLVVTGPISWDGTFTLPTITSTPSITPDSGMTATAVTVIEVGAGNIPLMLSAPVKLTFAGQAGASVAWSQNNIFHKINAICDNSTAPTLADGAECRIDVGADLVVWTKHLTTFLTYTQATAVAGGGSNGGGFSGGSVSTGGTVGQVLGASTTTVPQTTPVTVSVISSGNGSVLGASMFNFMSNMSFGARGNDVIELHKMLIASGHLKIAAPTGWFGPLTKAALIKWQAAHELPATGYFGPMTRAVIAKMSGQ